MSCYLIWVWFGSYRGYYCAQRAIKDSTFAIWTSLYQKRYTLFYTCIRRCEKRESEREASKNKSFIFLDYDICCNYQSRCSRICREPHFNNKDGYNSTKKPIVTTLPTTTPRPTIKEGECLADNNPSSYSPCNIRCNNMVAMVALVITEIFSDVFSLKYRDEVHWVLNISHNIFMRDVYLD